MSNRAWVTLATNDSYGLGALVLAHSLRRAGSTYPSVVLITPSVTDAMRERLRAVFAEVVIVDVLDSKDAAHLALLQRPELGITFTKIHCWNLTQYEKCVFLDADTLIVQNCDELFERDELSAAPDVGWPDCFNSGVFVFKPSAETFDSLVKFAQERGSFDGGDQGLLNSYFSDWAHGDINKHLPFLYNVTSAAFYSYIPALQHYGQNLKIIHFIGTAKPWLQQFNWETRTAEAPQHLREFLQLWWDIFVGHVHSQLNISMTGVAGNLARVVLGASAQQEALDDLTRRQGWEAGNIDYMGADAFDNIWAKISRTLSQPRTSPPKQSTPPPATVPTPVEAAPPVEEKPAESPAPVEAPAPQATTVVDTPAPAIPLEASVPSEAPAEKPEAAKTETPVLAAKPPESSAPVKAPAAVPEPAKPAETGVEVSTPSPAPAVAEPPAAPEPAKTVAEVAPTEEPKVATPAAIPASPAIPVEEPVAPVAAPAVPVETPAAPVEAPVVPVEAPAAPVEAPVVPVEAPAAPVEAPVVPVEAPATPSEAAVKAQASEAAAVTPKAVSPPQSPAAAAPSKPKAPKPEVTPEKGASPTDSPPLANTPSKEEVPIVPAAKSEERRKPAEKLQLPAAAVDALPTPDSELEDAAALAHAIIASELRTPTVTSSSPGADPASTAPPASPLDQRRLSADEQAPPTPPAGVSLAQIGVKPKPTIAAQIETSVTEAADPAPKKKVVKKVLKKEAAPGEAPVPPPRKKEKKPKDK